MWKYVLFQAALHTLGRLPTRALYVIATIVGDILYFLLPHYRHQVWDNLRHVLGTQASKQELRRVARQVFRNWAKNYADLIRLPRLNLEDFFHRRLRYYGFDEVVVPAVEAGKGVIVVSAHFGSPELAIQGLLPRGLKVIVLTEPLKPPRLSRLVDGLRASKGHTFLPISVASVKQAMRTLKAGGVVALMCDRDIAGPKARLPFCGAEADMPTGAIEVALRTGATVIPCFVHRREKDKVEAILEEPLELVRSGDFQADVRTNAIRLLNRFEEHLRQDPGQWVVLESVWDSERPGREPVAAGEGAP